MKDHQEAGQQENSFPSLGLSTGVRGHRRGVLFSSIRAARHGHSPGRDASNCGLRVRVLHAWGITELGIQLLPLCQG